MAHVVAVHNLNVAGVAGAQGGQQFFGWPKRRDTTLSSQHKSVIVDVDDANANQVVVEAQFTAQTSNQGTYNVKLVAREHDGRFLSATCSCPIGGGGGCKHICRLYELAMTQDVLPNPAYLHRANKRRRQEDLIAERVCCFVAFASKSEIETGDWNSSVDRRENFDAEILGIFFKIHAANALAKEHARDLGFEDDEEEGEDEDEDEDEDEEDLFAWDNEEEADEYWYHKVWVEKRAIEDASPLFHK